MAAVAQRHGEDAVAVHMIPVSVDGMIVVAGICLVEIARRTPADASAVSERAPAVPVRAPTLGALLPAALDVARRIASSGTPPSGRVLAAALRAEGRGVAARNVRPLRRKSAAYKPAAAQRVSGRSARSPPERRRIRQKDRSRHGCTPMNVASSARPLLRPRREETLPSNSITTS
jgi:hypothetical protein